MPLSAGAQLGPYEILSPLGAGGMGEVYRARDTRLGREVAIKILPRELSGDADRLRRFEKEAQAASSLNHPNIVTIHDVEQVDSTSFIVMELVDGKTLRDLLSEGAMPVRKLLGIAVQVADGLARAHAVGIVHRDLKPENVMVTKDGLVKILDFGLAKLVRPDRDAGELTQGPTVSGGTSPGVVMGTVGYMSPEQASGHPVDFRSDQFSFGAVLYEMATGKAPFRKPTAAQTLAAIIQDEPEPITAINAKIPAPLRWIIERCLSKEPRERYASTEDLARDLAGVRDHLSEASFSGEPIAIAPVRSRRRIFSALALAAVFVAGTLLTAAYFRVHRAPVSTLRVSILPPEKTRLSMTGEDVGDVPAPVAVSPDGERLVFGAIDGNQTRLYVRPLESFAGRPLQGTEGASYPFWSPDGSRIAFFTEFPRGQLRVINADGGPVETVVDAPNARGGSWSPAGTIVFSPQNSGAIFWVSEKGGHPTPVTFPSPAGAITHRYPSFLPDGRHFLYLAKRVVSSESVRDDQLGVFVGSTDSRETRRVLPDISRAAYAYPGYILFVREGTLMALPFDPSALEATGSPITIVPNVEFALMRSFGVFSASSSASEVLAFRSGANLPISRLEWIDRAGNHTEVPAARALVDQFRLSSDGKRASLTTMDSRTGELELFVSDLLHGTRVRLTGKLSPYCSASVLSPDGRRVVLVSRGVAGSEDLSAMDSSGEGALESLVSSREAKTPTDWSQDGRFILFDRIGPRNFAEVWVYSVPERRARLLIHDESGARNAVFSPDGRWVAYVSHPLGEAEIFVRPFPGPGNKQQVSRGGGGQIRWSRDRLEIVYAAGGKLMAVDVKGKDSLETGEPHAILSLPPGTDVWDITPDHQRILIAAKPTEDGSSPSISVITNWAARLRK